MNLLTCMLALTASLAASVTAATIPAEDCDVKSKLADPHSTVQFEQAMGNLSYMFGWQLAGSLSADESDAACENITSLGHGHFFAEGLIPEYIQEPICNLTGRGGPNATVAVPYTILYSTELFITQILNAFAPNNTNTSLAYLCDNLRFLALDGFHLNDARVINATCAGASLQLPLRPAQPAIAPIDNSSTTAYVNTVSTLFGLLYASSGTSGSVLNRDCAHAPDYITAENELLLNGTLVAETICNVTLPMTPDQGTAAIRTLTTRSFTTVIENVSNVSGWLSWLCSNLDADAMNAVGLDGLAVQTQVCSDASSAS